MSMDSLGFKKFSDRALTISPEHDPEFSKKIIPFGIDFLDRMLIGIFPDDFILIGAKTGAGKSGLANEIAMNAGALQKRVVPFALEATPGEWEMRIKHRFYSDFLLKARGPTWLSQFTYRDFRAGILRDVIAPYKDQVEAMVKEMDTISVFYRGRDFGKAEFVQKFNALNDKADLVIIDHLHYFDTADDENENKAFSEIMKTIRDLNQLTGIPVIIIGHLRKSYKKDAELVPSEDEFHGTSNIAKIATVILTIAPGEQLSDSRFGTYFRISKCREEGRVSRYVGLGTFDADLNRYEEQFILGKLVAQGKEFEAIPKDKYPKWYARRGKK